jgi:hypothetical protein
MLGKRYYNHGTVVNTHLLTTMRESHIVDLWASFHHGAFYPQGCVSSHQRRAFEGHNVMAYFVEMIISSYMVVIFLYHIHIMLPLFQ